MSDLFVSASDSPSPAVPSLAASSPAGVAFGKLVEVNTPVLAREFREFAVRLYGDDPHYVRPLDEDVEGVFDPARNKFFGHGQLCRWLLQDVQGRTQGRVAAFVNERTAPTFAQPTGGMGFFECINDQAAANQLFEAARTWLQHRGMEAMDGPINFGDRDQWWGLLLQNFGRPLYGQNYNPPYYQQLFETYGFQVYFNQYTCFRSLGERLHPVYDVKAKRLLQSPGYSFKHLDFDQLDKFTNDFRQVYNQAWAQHDGVEEMTLEQAQALMQKMRPVLDERLAWLGYYDGEPIAIFVALPELNELFRYVGGRLDLRGKLIFAWHRWRGRVRTATGIVFGVVPAFQRRGVEAALVTEAAKVVMDPKQVPYRDFVMNWIGDFNPRMMAVVTQMGAHIWRTHATYRYLFDRSKPFERAPAI